MNTHRSVSRYGISGGISEVDVIAALREFTALWAQLFPN